MNILSTHAEIGLPSILSKKDHPYFVYSLTTKYKRLYWTKGFSHCSKMDMRQTAHEISERIWHRISFIITSYINTLANNVHLMIILSKSGFFIVQFMKLTAVLVLINIDHYGDVQFYVTLSFRNLLWVFVKKLTSEVKMFITINVSVHQKGLLCCK